jgi:hypothetical protein
MTSFPNREKKYPKYYKNYINWIGHIFRRNFLLKHIIKRKIGGGIEVTEIHGRRRKQLLDDPEETGGYWKLKAEALDSTLWRTRF